MDTINIGCTLEDQNETVRAMGMKYFRYYGILNYISEVYTKLTIDYTSKDTIRFV